MKKILFVFLTLTVFIMASNRLQAENYQLSPADYMNLADQQVYIEREWPKLVLARKDCEASCATNKCSCLDELKTKELEVIKVMVSHENTWNGIKAEPRSFILHYYWNPKDLRCRKDLKELLLVLPETASIKKRELSLSLFSYGDVEGALASVLQEMYAVKKISDIQAYLKATGIINVRMPKEFENTDTPNFLLVRDDPNQRGKVQDVIFGSMVFADDKFASFENNKFPWTSASIDMMVALAKSRRQD